MDKPEIDDIMNQIGPYCKEAIIIENGNTSRVSTADRRAVRKALKNASEAHFRVDLIINLKRKA